MAHILVRHPAGDLRSCESAVLPIRHMLWLDGVYEPMATRPGKPRLHRTHAPTCEQLTQLADKISPQGRVRYRLKTPWRNASSACSTSRCPPA